MGDMLKSLILGKVMVNSKEEILKFLKQNKEFLHKRFGVKKIALFGSFSKGSFKKDSDIDILVELETDNIFRNFFNLKIYLKSQLGREIDLGTFKALKKSIKKDILKEAIYV